MEVPQQDNAGAEHAQRMQKAKAEMLDIDDDSEMEDVEEMLSALLLLEWSTYGMSAFRKHCSCCQARTA